MKKNLLTLIIIVGLAINSYAADQNLENLRDEIKSLEITIEVYSSKLIKAEGEIAKKKKTLKSYQDNIPTVISIDKDGNYYISPMDDSSPKSISFERLITTARERIKARPEMKVFIKADKSVDYGTVIKVAAILKQRSNLVNIGFMTSPEDSSSAIKDEQEALKEKARKIMAELKRKAEVEKEKELLNTLQNAYLNNIAARIKTFWRYQSAEDDWSAEVYIVQDRDGNVIAVDVRNANVSNSKLAKSFMDSIERAVNKASPLPGAPNEAVFDKELYFIFSVN